VRLQTVTRFLRVPARPIGGLALLVAIVFLGGGDAIATASSPAAHGAGASRNHMALVVRGGTLHWTRVPGVSRYLVAVMVSPHPVSYRLVRGLTFTPRPRPTQTVRFRVRAAVRSAPWSRLVAITYHQTNGPLQRTGAASGGGTTRRGASSTASPTSSAGTQPSSPDSSSPGPLTDKLKVGVMDLGNYNYPPFYSASLFSQLGITYTREDVDRGQDTGTCDGADYVCTALRNGITPLVLFEGYADGNVTTEIVNLAQKLDQLAATYPIMNKLHVIEFGNEVYWGTSGPAENATTYGRQYNAAHAALAAAGLGSWKLLAVGNGLGTCVNSYTSPEWIDQVIAAQSSGPAGIDGWTVHPYGPMTTDFGCGAPGQGFGWPIVVDYHNTAVSAGSDAPWYVTEVGQCLGGAGCNDPVPMGNASDMPQAAGSAPYYTQAADMRQYLTDAGGDTRTGAAARYPWIAALIFYQAYDDSSGWFGLASNGTNLSQPVNYQRPALSELERWIAANGEG
jgi:hypothetical protein